MDSIFIEALHSIDPPSFLSSLEIEKKLSKLYSRIGLAEGRLEALTGISKRGFWDKEVLPSDIAIEAGKELFSNNPHLKIEDIDLVINCSVCRDQWEPSTASRVHNKLNLKDEAFSFDLSNACLGVFSGIEVAKAMISSGKCKKVLLVSGENAHDLIHDTIDYLNNDETLTRKSIKEHIASLTIGSSAVALVLGKDDGLKIKSSISLSDTSAHNLCKGGKESTGVFMRTFSEDLLHAGINLAVKGWKLLTKNIDFKKDYKVVTHQVGKTHHDYLLKNLEISSDRSFQVFKDYGNSGTVAAFNALFKALNSDFIKKNDQVFLLGIGSGVHTSMLELEC